MQKTEWLYKNVEDDNEKGHVVFVPGSNKAIQIYNEGRAKKILFSGRVIWEGTELSEAHFFNI
ncbi:hypothetical protein [Peribacillus muralis]|uniref:hypothetical protein n=1 Tax=Peribacillus muralis TaxID=264697 RepID=UPI003CFDB11B